MTESEKPNLLPESESPIDAFEEVKKLHTYTKTHGDVGKLPISVANAATRDYLLAGFEHIAKRGADDYLKDLGSTALFTVRRGFTQYIPTYSVSATLKRMKFPNPDAVIGARVDEPQAITASPPGSKHPYVVEQNMLIVPYYFIWQAGNRPLEALATLTRCSSEIKDQLNGLAHLLPSNEMIERSIAAEAHFLKGVLDRYPGANLSPQFWNSLYQFPNGIPQYMMYNGVTEEGIDRASRN